MEIAPADIIEELLDPLMMGTLGDDSPEVTFKRLAANRLLLDFGLPDTVFTVTVEAVSRQPLP